SIGGRLAPIDLHVENGVDDLVIGGCLYILVTAAHDLSEGGLLAALAEMGLPKHIGAELQVDIPTSWLFAETPGRFLITVRPEHQAAFDDIMGNSARLLGRTVAAPQFTIQAPNRTFTTTIAALEKSWEDGIPCRMK
ncbi:MAG: AIR synthase-related protein, partial [Schleiferilactobacillus perolens]|uniref:AIR synthase-related protein n=1 Tax=Schleiferilactobacillus perolens TaxID=100468 RepID=UPI0039EBEA8C